MNVLDLFSGIGGFSLGLERAGMRTVAFCEIDPYCRAVLAKHWPHVPCYDDVTTLTAARLAADGIDADIICGGFPCQPVSVAGQRKAGADDRWLWPEYARLIRDIRPRYAIIENVPGLLSTGKDRPDMGCLCGWFGRRRRLDLGAEGQDDATLSSRCYQAGLEGTEYPGGTPPPSRRTFQFGETSSQRKTRRDILLEGAGNGGTRRAADDLSIFEDQEGASCYRAALGLDMGDWGQRSIFDLPPASNVALGAQQNGTGICPACGGQLAVHPDLVGGAAAAEVFNDLAEIGMAVEWASIPASAVGAPHRRDRVWVVADACELLDGCGASGPRRRRQSTNGGQDLADASVKRLSPPQRETLFGAGRWDEGRAVTECGWWLTQSRMGDLADGLPPKMDGGGLNEQQELSALRQADASSQMVERKTGRDIQEQKILQPYLLRSLYGEPWVGKTEKRQEECTAKSENDLLQPLRTDNEITAAPQRSEYEEQQPEQYRSALSEMSHPGSPTGWDMGNFWSQEPPGTPRVASGVKNRVNRLRSLGNAVVPQIPEIIGRAIMKGEPK